MGAADWFTKEGYYATLTAYKIAVVSSWLQIYKQELLFSTVRKRVGASLVCCMSEVST